MTDRQARIEDAIQKLRVVLESAKFLDSFDIRIKGSSDEATTISYHITEFVPKGVEDNG